MSIHSQFTGLELHEAYHYVQESDPGAVGAKLYWLKVSTGTVKRRADDNGSWIIIGGSSGLTDPTTTKGDLIVRNSTVVSRLGVGSDGQILAADSAQTLGVKWATPSGFGLIGRTVLGSNAATMTFSVPATFSDLLLMGISRTDNADVFDEVLINFNADTTDSNYQSSIIAHGSGLVGANDAYGYFGNAAGANSDAHYVGMWQTTVPNYNGAIFFKSWAGYGASERQSSSRYVLEYSGAWRNQAAITNVTIKPKFGSNFITGSVFAVYGLK